MMPYARLNRLTAVGLPPTVVAAAAAGDTATITELTGSDLAFFFRVTPGGAGIATGSFLSVTFAQPRVSANFLVFVTPHSSAARAHTGKVGPTARSGTGFQLATGAALTSGQAYQFGVLVVDLP